MARYSVKPAGENTAIEVEADRMETVGHQVNLFLGDEQVGAFPSYPVVYKLE